ncbi:MAG: HAD family hydrolase [Candidatus Aphodosoma sp.]
MVNYNGLKVLIFDFGGVLINLNRARSVREFERLGVYDAGRLLSNYVQDGIFLQLESGQIGACEFHDRIRKMYGLEHISDDAIDTAFAMFLEDIPVHRLDLIRRLKRGVYNEYGEKLRIVMLSNTNEIHFPDCRKRYFESGGYTSDDYFDRYYLSYEMKMSKPDENIFLALLESEGVKPEECMFFDDGEQNIITAGHLGLRTQWVTDDICEYFR